MRPELHLKAETSPFAPFGAICAAALLAGLASLFVSGAWSAGFSGADEPAHFLNTYFLALYASEALGAHPMTFATEFYLHYPKISIGHWPPAYYALLSPFFLVLPATPGTAFALNLVMASIAPVLAGLLAARLARPIVGVGAAAAVAMTPVALEAQAFFMLDQPLAGATLAATMIWAAYVARPKPWKVLAFALAAATAVLVKGNGWLLLFVPLIHLSLTGRWRILASPWPWAAGVLAALLIGPWYWLTAGIASDGFNYSPGLAYAWRALLFNLGALSQNLTPAGLLLAAWGGFHAFRERRESPGRWNLSAACLSLAAATLILQSLVPADLEARYVAPALPPLAALALSGAWSLASARSMRWEAAAVVLSALLLSLPGLLHLAEREPKIDLRMAEAAAAVGPAPAAWVIDGTSGAEGAFVAAMAVRDRQLRSYAIRSSRLLAESNFMGSEYRLVTSDPAEVLARLRALGVEGIVISRIGHEPAFPHSELLRRALSRPGSPWRLSAALPHGGRPGVTEIYRAREPLKLDEPAIRALGIPEKANALAGR